MKMHFTPLNIKGMTEKAMNAHILRSRIEFRLHRLPIAAKHNTLREQLWQEHGKLSRIIESERAR